MIDLSSIPDARYRAILGRKLSTEDTLERIAQDYGVTRERIRQICNVALNSLSDEDYRIARDILDKHHLNAERKRQAKLDLKQLKKRLRAALLTGFDRDQILEIIGLADDPDASGLSEIELCELLYDQFFLGDCYKYIRCCLCKTFKLRTEFMPSVARVIGGKAKSRVCRICNTRRTRWSYHNNPNTRKLQRKWTLAHPNRARVAMMRYYWKQMGRPDKMPPIPPRGLPDHKIVLPPRRPRGDWWSDKTPKQLAEIQAKRLRKYRDWFDNLTPKQYQEYCQKMKHISHKRWGEHGG